MSASPERHDFQAEVTQLLDIVVHSLYSHRDIFLRELISNASDALDKVRIEGLTNAALLPADELHIRLDRDRELRTLSVADNGIGMTREEIVDNIGTIAKSGTAEFLKAVREAGSTGLDTELIGQFGVGFYSAFMVADRVTVVTRRAGEDGATKWESAGEGWFTIADAERETPGTTVTLHLKSVDDEQGIRDYTEEWVVREIVKRYSDFVAYPIRMTVEHREHERDADGNVKEGGSVRVTERDETLNSMKAIWTRPAGDVTDDEYREFYKHISHDWNDPLIHLTARMEGAVDARALLYVPSRAPFDLYHAEMSYRGLQLYVKRVFILDECRDLMPRHLRFVRGVVDAEDVSLNVSRELLQQDRQITAIRRFLVRKVMDALTGLKKNEPEKFETFWTEFGPVLKEGLLDWQEKREPIFELVMALSTRDATSPTSLADYVGRMKSGQEHIYYLTGPSLDTVRRSPHLEAFVEQGYEVLYFTDPVDEIWLQNPPEYQGHAWRSVGRGAVELGTDDERKSAQERLQEQTKSHQGLMSALYEHLKDDVKEVRLSTRLRGSAACLVGDTNDLSPQVAEMLRRAGQDVPDVKRILELNPSHPIVDKLQARFDGNAADDVIEAYAKLLYGQAVLAEGGQLRDPAEFTQKVTELMVQTL